MSREERRIEERIRRRRESKRRSEDRQTHLELPPIDPGAATWTTVRANVPGFLRAVFQFRSGRAAPDPFVLGWTGIAVFGALFAASTVTGMFGMLGYFGMGGRFHFNPWFLFLMPIASALFTVVGGSLSAIVTYFVAKRNKEHWMFLWALATLPYVALPAAWIAYPVRLVFPVWQFPHFYAAAVVYAYMSLRAGRTATSYMSLPLTIVLLIPGAVVLAAFRWAPLASEFVVKSLQL